MPCLASALGEVQRTLCILLAAIMQGLIARFLQAVHPIRTAPIIVTDDEGDRGRPSVFIPHVHLNSIAYLKFSRRLYSFCVSAGKQ